MTTIMKSEPTPSAPTGRAANRMNEATGFEAKTIHRLLEVDPRTGGFRRAQAGGRRRSGVDRRGAHRERPHPHDGDVRARG